MKTVFKLLLPVIICLFAGLKISCTGKSSPLALGGSGTGVGNGVIMGKVTDAMLKPVQNATVRLRTQSYLADTSGVIATSQTDTSITVLTSAAGQFVFTSVRSRRSYRIEVLNFDTTNYYGTRYDCSVDSGDTPDTIRLSSRILQPVKEIQGAVILSGLPQNAYVQVYGIERIGKTDSSGSFVIERLPVGECEHDECEYDLRVLIVQKDGTVITQNYELEIKTDGNNNVVRVELELEN